MTSLTEVDSLNSGVVASIVETSPGVFTVYTRTDYEENLGIYSFVAVKKTFTTLAQAEAAFKKGWTHGTLVPFADLTTHF